MSEIQLTTLSNGLRIITDSVDSVQSVALGIWAGVGARNEIASNNGVAHMVEHMLFKGTKIRSSQEIAEVIENVGGHMNAYTSREVTSYHMHLLKDHTPLALDVLSDMYQNSTMPAEEIERERHVILQEIGMCNDTPDDLIFDHYYETAYPDQALGAPILGTTDIVSKMSREALQSHIDTNYNTTNTVISAAGNISHDDFVSLVEDKFGALRAGDKAKNYAANYQGGEHRLDKELEQSHLIIGFQGISRLDDNLYAAQALSNILGGGMSSRLFQEVREKRGLVYSIFSFHTAHQDDGQFGIYAGTGPTDLEELVPVVCDEVAKASSTITDEELSRAKAQLKSSMLMARENMMTRADQHAKVLIHRDRVFDQNDIVQKIEALQVADLQNIAAQIFASKPTIVGLGPLEKLAPYEHIAEKLAA